VVQITRRSVELARALPASAQGFVPGQFEAETYEQMLAMALESQSMAEFMTGRRAKAIALIKLALVQFPEGGEYPARLALYQQKP
jgi:hypothetical protein